TRALARRLVLREASGRRGIRDREIESVAGAHAHGAKTATLRIRVDEIDRGLVGVAPEQLIEEPARRARRGAILRPAIVLRQRDHHGAPLLAAIEVAAAQPLQVDIDAVEI